MTEWGDAGTLAVAMLSGETRAKTRERVHTEGNGGPFSLLVLPFPHFLFFFFLLFPRVMKAVILNFAYKNAKFVANTARHLGVAARHTRLSRN